MGEQTVRSRLRGPDRVTGGSAHHVRSAVGRNGLDENQRVQVVVQATYWQPQSDLDIAEWIYHGKRLGSIGRAVSWWIGDWVNYGNSRFGEKYTRAARITGYDVQSLMNMAYVASRFECSRRRQGLSWSHHAELAGLEPHLQDMWLDRVEATSLSVRGLREELRTWRGRQRELSAVSEKGNVPGSGPAGPRHAGKSVVCPQCGFHITTNGRASG
jgi:hypothetical protein